MASASAKRGYLWMAAIVAVVVYVAWPSSKPAPQPVETAPVTAMPPEARAKLIQEGKVAAAAKDKADTIAASKHLMTELAGTVAVKLRAAMRDPESFRLVSAVKMIDGTVCYEYRSRNGFGGMTVGHATFDESGKVRVPEGADSFPANWNKRCAGKHGEDITSYMDAALELAGPPR